MSLTWIQDAGAAGTARTARRVLWLAGALAVLAVVICHPASAAPAVRVSVATGGGQADDASAAASVADDGTVAFESLASNLVANDNNESCDVFVYDPQTETTERVSVASDGTEADSYSTLAAISADGRYVAFVSEATNLVADDTNGIADVFVRDRQTGTTTRVSVATDGTEADGPSTSPSISADGRIIAFVSAATNLVAGDANAMADVFVHNAHNGHTERVSVASDGSESAGEISGAAISGDGWSVAFCSTASDLVDGDTNGVSDIFVNNRQTGETIRVSVATDGTQADGASTSPAINDDGTVVAFASAAANLVAGDTNGAVDIFVHDSAADQTERASLAHGGGQVAGASYNPSLSADGRYVSFSSAANGVVPLDTYGRVDVFLHDREAGWTDWLSVGPMGEAGDAASGPSSLSRNARYVAFESLAANLVAGDTNLTSDIFLFERPLADFTADVTSGTVPLTVTFSDLSTGGPTTWDWDFGDGTGVGAVSGEDQVHTYNVAGSYTVTLTVSYGYLYGSDTMVKPDYITVVAPVPHADFSGTPTTGTAPLTVTFTDLSTNTPTLWVWAFGDGSTSTDQDPTHIYTVNGTYTVALVATNEWGFDVETKHDYITVGPQPPIANFSATPTTGFAPLNVTFDDLSTNGPTAWAWQFGDGATSTAQDPTHEYLEEGTYTVTLTATNVEGSDAETKAHYILVTFPDVPFDPEHWALHEILACVDAGIVQGYWNGYHPDQVVTRDQMAVYVSRAMCGGDAGVQVPSGVVTPTFPDVGTDHWAYRHIEYCFGNGIVQGYPNGDYRPGEAVNRGQMAVYIARSVATPTGDPGIPPATAVTFADVTADNDWAWCYDYVEYCAAAEIVQGYWDGYHPEREVTRDQMAVYIQRAFELPM